MSLGTVQVRMGRVGLGGSGVVGLIPTSWLTGAARAGAR